MAQIPILTDEELSKDMSLPAATNLVSGRPTRLRYSFGLKVETFPGLVYRILIHEVEVCSYFNIHYKVAEMFSKS